MGKSSWQYPLVSWQVVLEAHLYMIYLEHALPHQIHFARWPQSPSTEKYLSHDFFEESRIEIVYAVRRL
jgi:hypothetical protein